VLRDVTEPAAWRACADLWFAHLLQTKEVGAAALVALVRRAVALGRPSNHVIWVVLQAHHALVHTNLLMKDHSEALQFGCPSLIAMVHTLFDAQHYQLYKQQQTQLGRPGAHSQQPFALALPCLRGRLQGGVWMCRQWRLTKIDFCVFILFAFAAKASFLVPPTATVADLAMAQAECDAIVTAFQAVRACVFFFFLGSNISCF
jgi:hypothetical protein